MTNPYARLCEEFDMLPTSSQMLFITNRVGFAKDDAIEWEYRKRHLDKF